MLGVRLGADGAHAADLAGVDRWEQVLPLGAWLPDVEVGPDDDATILYTSGTTGRPKGAVSTHRAVTQALMGYACRGAGDRLRRPQPADDGANGGRPAPAFILSYWNRPEATAETIVDGWLRTGDIGRLDAEGFVYIEDRAKDMVLRGGENVYSAEVEAAIYEHPAVHEAAVFGVPHERLGEEVAAVVVPRAGETVTAAVIQAHVRERLAPFKVPSRIAVWAQPLPRNPAGKVRKRDLRDGFDAPS